MDKKIAITVTNMDGLNSPIDQRFGRAFAFLIVNEKSREIVTQIKNDAVDAAHGAGTGAAAIMANNNVNKVISGRFGPKAYQALGQLNIDMMIAPEAMTVTEALDNLASGDLEQMKLKVY